MAKIINWYRNNIIPNIIAFLIVGALSVLGFCLVYFLQGQTIQSGANGSAVGFAISGAICGFSILNRFGAFDTLGYGGAMFVRMFSFKQEKKYEDLIEYRHVKNMKRSNSFFYFTYGVVAIIFLILLIIFEIKFSSFIR